MATNFDKLAEELGGVAVDSGAPVQGGRALTEQDIAASQAIQNAWNATGNYDEVARVAAQFGRSFAPVDEQFLRANQGKPVNIQANATGQITAAPAQETPEQDYDKLAENLGGEAVAEEAVPAATTTEGVLGAAARGLAPAAAGAALGGLVGGPAGAGLGAAVATAAPIVVDPIVNAVNQRFGTKFQTANEVIQNLLTSAGVPQPQTATERVTQSAASGLGGAGGMIGLGRTMAGAASPLAQRVGNVLQDQLAAQLIGSTTGGATQQVAAESGAGPIGQAVAGLAGGLFGGAPFMSRQRVPLPAEIAMAEQAGIPVMTSDVRPPQTFVGRSVQATGERIPVAGTGPVREAQQTARVQAVRDLLNDYQAIDSAGLPERLVADLAARRAASIGKYSTDKSDVINRLANFGEVPMPNTIKKIDDEIMKLRQRKTEAGEAAAVELENIRQEVQKRNLFELEAYRRDVLSNVFKDDPARPMSIAVREAGEKALRAIYDPVRQDMGAFIKANGQRRDFDKWMVANRRLSEEAGELNKQALASVFRRGDATPEVVENLLFSAKRSDVAALSRNLTPQGKTVARQAVLARAAKKAEVDTPEGRIISPDKFKNEVKRLSNQVGILFSGNDLDRLEGLVRILNVTRRAGEAGALPATGVQNVLPTAAFGGVAAFGGGLTGFLGALAAAGSAGAAARIYESAPVRNILLQASKTKNEQKLIELSKRLVTNMEAAAAMDNEEEK